MKKIMRSVLFLAAVFTMASCSNDWLDVDPSDSLPTSEAISNYKDATSALNGIYDGLQGNSDAVSYYARNMFFYGDVRGDDMQARTQGMRSSSLYEMRYTEDDAPAIWVTPYNVIRRANNLIEAIEAGKVNDASEVELNNMVAQAKAVRALVHFDLARIYGKPYTVDNGASAGIPIVTRPVAASEQLTRNTVAEVYEQVISDLTEAINSNALSEEKTLGMFNVWAAKALLSRVYLYKGDNENALAMAEDVINNSPYALWTTDEYVDGWVGDNRKEMILEIVNYSSADWADREGIAYCLNETGYADAIVTQAFSDLLNKDMNDVRQGVILKATDPTLGFIEEYGDQQVFVNKFPAKEPGGDYRVSNLPLLRVSEMYLNAAEAAAKLGQSDKAAQYLNAIVLRANPEATEVSPAEATVDRILDERRLELVGEGHRFFDLMRNNKTVVRYESLDNMGRHYALIQESTKFDNTYFRAILPIPISEINANPNIEQNPGY